MRRAIPVIGVILAVGLTAAQLPNDSAHRDDFTARIGWRRGPMSVECREDAHAITSQFSHSGPRSEYLKLTFADPGGHLSPTGFYAYSTPPAPIGDDTGASVWLRSNRAGVQLYARCVLPRERDPTDPDRPLTVLLPGEVYSLGGGRWQRLELRQPARLLAEQRGQLRAKFHRDVAITDAVIDQLVLQVYTGPGEVELWIDDLEIRPVTAAALARSIDPTTPAGPARTAAEPPPVDFSRDQLRVGGKPLLFRGIRYGGTPLKPLRDAGLNTLFLPEAVGPELLDEAARLGLWLAPTLHLEPGHEPSVSSVGHFPREESVLFWHLGDWRSLDDLPRVSKAVSQVKSIDAIRPVAADVREGFWSYSRPVDLIGAHRWPLMTSLELTGYRDWLTQRRLLARPDSFFWTWIQTHLPEWYLRAVQPNQSADGFAEPIGPQPEQIRLLTYLSLASGFKGIAFYSDQYLADSHHGRDRLLAIALLNQEIALLEPLLLGAIDPPYWIDTSIPAVKAAVIRCGRGLLVLPIWIGEGAQYVPGQSAAHMVSFTVPQVPTGTQAWVIGPGEVRSLYADRVVGGTRVTLTEFDQTAAVVFTGDNSPTGLLVHWQEHSRRLAKSAAQWTYDLANVSLVKVEHVQGRLDEMGLAIPDSAKLIRASRDKLSQARGAWESGDYRQAYHEAQRAQRPLRVLMRAQWEYLVRGLDTPVSSPFAVSYYTLPRHAEFLREVQRLTPGANVLPGGDFEASQLPPEWTIVRHTADEVELSARRVGDKPRDGQGCLELKVTPRKPPGQQPAGPPPAALERTLLWVQSPPARLNPGEAVKISAWVRIPNGIGASADGAVFFDSAGGESLGVRLVKAVPQWKQYTLYRRVPESGVIQVTVALTGLGRVLVDDIRVEPLGAPGE